LGSGFLTPNTEHRTPDTGHLTPDTEHLTPNTCPLRGEEFYAKDTHTIYEKLQVSLVNIFMRK
jgi:hypothetical protein